MTKTMRLSTRIPFYNRSKTRPLRLTFLSLRSKSKTSCLNWRNKKNHPVTLTPGTTKILSLKRRSRLSPPTMTRIFSSTMRTMSILKTTRTLTKSLGRSRSRTRRNRSLTPTPRTMTGM